MGLQRYGRGMLEGMDFFSAGRRGWAGKEGGVGVDRRLSRGGRKVELHLSFPHPPVYHLSSSLETQFTPIYTSSLLPPPKKKTSSKNETQKLTEHPLIPLLLLSSFLQQPASSSKSPRSTSSPSPTLPLPLLTSSTSSTSPTHPPTLPLISFSTSPPPLFLRPPRRPRSWTLSPKQPTPIRKRNRRGECS